MTEPKCLHEDRITYLGLIQFEGCPQYIVRCEDCGKKGVIYLQESEEDWECFDDENTEREKVFNATPHPDCPNCGGIITPHTTICEQQGCNKPAFKPYCWCLEHHNERANH